MKILYLITQADGGGAQNYILALAKHFGGGVAAGSETTELFEVANKLGLTTFHLEHLKRNISPYHDLMAIWEIRQLVQSYRPDIVHLNSSKAGVLGSFACMGLKTKVVFTAHGFVFNEPLSWPVKSLYLALEKEASRYRGQIITVSEADRDSALKFKLIAPEKISTVHNGLSPINFLPKQEALAKLKLPSDRFLFATTANFYKTKGLDVLVEAVALLKEETKQKCRFVIFGEGPEGKNLRLKIKALNLEPNFILHGKTEHASQYLKAFDAFVFPSRKEGFPFAVLEAAQAGLPVLASKTGGVPEILGENGFYTEPENPAELAIKIERLTNDSSFREKLTLLSQEQAKIFTLENMLEQTENIYKKVLR
jgi:glycosyltransferase involved in cell wall biosynthesis